MDSKKFDIEELSNKAKEFFGERAMAEICESSMEIRVLGMDVERKSHRFSLNRFGREEGIGEVVRTFHCPGEGGFVACYDLPPAEKERIKAAQAKWEKEEHEECFGILVYMGEDKHPFWVFPKEGKRLRHAFYDIARGVESVDGMKVTMVSKEEFDKAPI